MIFDRLREVPLFGELDDAHLRTVCEGASERRLAAGDRLFDEGDAGDSAYLITAGQVEIWKMVENRRVRLALRGEGHVIGEMSLLEETPRTATVDALTDVELIAIPKNILDVLLDNSPAAARSIFGVLLDRWKSTEVHLRQSQRMAQLGTLTAGLAHELNNPAAAVRRGAASLRDAARRHTESYARVALLGLDPSQTLELDHLIAQTEGAVVNPPPLDPISRADREEELAARMVEHGVNSAWNVAPELVDHLTSADEIDTIVATFGPRTAPAVLELVAASHALAAVLREVEEGASRLSGIVGALKSYSYLDRGPVQQVNLRVGIEDTLLILGGKLSGVTVRREFAPDLPTVDGHGSELNQVWTNLLDNAVDAVARTPNPTIVIRAFVENDDAVVEVLDNGPGIPPDVRGRVFDPFFTTKPPGKGTGLGLDISRSIVVEGHRGEMTVDSEPGRTVFRVALPLAIEPRTERA